LRRFRMSGRCRGFKRFMGFRRCRGFRKFGVDRCSNVPQMVEWLRNAR